MAGRANTESTVKKTKQKSCMSNRDVFQQHSVAVLRPNVVALRLLESAIAWNCI
jgi:hypothetical protein